MRWQSPRKSPYEENEEITSKPILTESDTKNVSPGVKSSPFMIPKESPPKINASGIASLVSPTEGTTDLLSNKSHVGGWVRPKETNTEDGDKGLGERVRSLTPKALLMLTYSY